MVRPWVTVVGSLVQPLFWFGVCRGCDFIVVPAERGTMYGLSLYFCQCYGGDSTSVA